MFSIAIQNYKTTIIGALIAGLYAIQNAGNLDWKHLLTIFAIAAFGAFTHDGFKIPVAGNTQKGFARVGAMAMLAAACLMLLLPLLMLSGCAAVTPKATTAQLTPWQQVAPALNATQTLNDTVLKTVINVNQAGLLSKDATAKVLTEQARVSDVIEQLNAIVQQGSAATASQSAQVAALIARIQTSATNMVNAGDLGVKAPGSQQTVTAIVDGLAASAETLIVVFGNAGITLPAPPAPPPVLVQPAPTAMMPAPGSPGPLTMSLAGVAGLPGLLLVILPLVLQEAPLIAADVVKLKALFSQAGLTPEQIDTQIAAIEADTVAIAEEDIGEANQWLTANGYAPYAHTPPATAAQ